MIIFFNEQYDYAKNQVENPNNLLLPISSHIPVVLSKYNVHGANKYIREIGYLTDSKKVEISTIL